jgi:bifunctional ADP-heptose synthase (sugar kinase/adenylyltransferase)
MKNILVAGDLIQDIFIYGTSDRINPEGPFPLVSQSYTEEKLGGVGNVLNNLTSLGIESIFVYPNEKNISTKTRIAVNNRIIFRYDNDVYSKEYLIPENFDNFDLSGIEYVILSDYNKGFLREVSPVIKMLNDKGCKVIVDPKQPFNVYKGVWCIKPNQKEFEEFYTEKEVLDLIRFKSIGIIKNSSEFNNDLLELFLSTISTKKILGTWSKEDIVDLFYTLIPDFQYKDKGKFLDEKM